MKCTACGLPLSPSRNDGNCPRCGTTVSADVKSSGGPVSYEPVSWNGNAGAPVSVGAPPPPQDGRWGQARPSAAFQPPMAQASQPGQIWAAGSNGMHEPGSFSPRQPAPTRPPRKSRVGFIVAGICVFTGGILLVLVYLLAMGQSGNTSTAGSTPTSTSATSSPAVTPSPAGSPSLTATTYPGQQYINNGQMSSVQPSASQPALPATAFKVHQTFYVVFNINSGGQAGAVCLIWYLNGKPAFNFAFAVGAHTTASYGQATFDLPGSGYVELYWASNKACTNQVLAQHVDFTITP
jgi:hypothetical protein